MHTAVALLYYRYPLALRTVLRPPPPPPPLSHILAEIISFM